jgi:hypothetical protein
MWPQNLFHCASQDDYPWEAGQTDRDGQVLIGVYNAEVVAVFFNDSGNPARFERRSSSFATPMKERSIDDSTFDAALQGVLDSWKREIDFHAAGIRVAPFFIPELQVGVSELPIFLQGFLENPSFVTSARERQEWHLDVSRWQAEGRFVLRWGKEYWMNKRGEVTDT